MRDADSDFYILPNTVKREVAEETGLDVTVGDIAFVIEGSRGEKHHRVDVVFLCGYGGAIDAERRLDSGQIGIEWLKVDGLNRQPLYPSKLRRPIMNLYEGRKTAVYLGNECVGDPEVTD